MHVKFDPKSPPLKQISFDDFLKVDIRIGEVIEVLDFPKARHPSYKLTIDFGRGIGTKKSSAQITTHYSKENLLHRKVTAVVNFAPRQIADFMSEVLVLGIADENGEIVLQSADKDLQNGSRLL